MLDFGVICLIPEILESLKYGVTGRAIEQGLASLSTWNPRDWASTAYRKVDDKPYGGGPGMVMMYEPLQAAIAHAKSQMPKKCKTVLLSPQGRVIQQTDLITQVEKKQPLLFVAGRYEGIDERILSQVDEEWSLGDFVLSGGELAAVVFIDAMIRLIPGSLGHLASAQQDSFMDGLLDCPHYTRPSSIDGLEVPAVLLNGNHHEITQWRKKQSLGKTWLNRPDLLAAMSLSKEEEQLLDEFKCENMVVSKRE